MDPRFKPGVDESGPKPYWGPVFCEKKRFSGERGMRTYQHKKAFALSKLFAVLFSVGFFIGGCGEPKPPARRATADLGVTIGSLIEVFSPDVVAVEGYGLVGGLEGTGSVECPPAIRAYLKRYIRQQLPEHKVDPDRFINSRNTAVVLLRGIMPVAVSKNQYFDVRVVAHPDTRTTSLKGGRLYKAELKSVRTLDMTIKALATVKGPVFIDTIDSASENKTGYILGGGIVLDEYKVIVDLLRPDFRTAAVIRDKLNKRFGDGTAEALSESRIELRVPANY
ncbi:MAG: flagellar basal body P-ring protein FlgI, partial [Planctomycetota bacterium]